ncbi:hypothetical protein DYB25_001926 [Aphanomyces astaci]|uniref:PARP-type domain-containing protein n=1 Tax=Aphanomyces astaci TaxID=112090 RepID=A0A397BGW5_APHAT|nr:hypothetical protein DYB25_001926 [Aphanomyces astaci]RHY22118.1 hypothetical protein DYB36_004252 [Aphanomyces astaci]RHY45851.1 hypothetical protein DYB34_004144 [Aphanomyces astaci]RHY58582.1 hypothetical protein DYB38_003226 [Aphanomyces astaci]RHY60477.1 hypothetical protein DYB30_003022 [Aphanomyces astaci]
MPGTTHVNPWKRCELPILGISKNGASTCQACRDAIQTGSIRVGIIFHHVNGNIGIDWHHLTCCETPATLPEVEGYELLGDHDKEVLHHWIQSCV